MAYSSQTIWRCCFQDISVFIHFFGAYVILFLNLGINGDEVTIQFPHDLTSRPYLNESSPPPPYQKWPPSNYFPICENLLSKESGVFSRKFNRPRMKIQDVMFNFSTTCEEIFKRGYYPKNAKSIEEAEFPIAFANIVYKDYIFLERVFNIIYAPQNFYCYSIDVKASEVFRSRMHDLANCFSNVVIPREEFDVSSAGYNVSSAHLSCMEALKTLSDKWKYVTLMQNHDVPLRTNAELVQIYKIFNGTNDVFTLTSTRGTVDLTANWTFANIHLFKNESMNLKRDESGELFQLNPTKSFVSVSLTHEMVEFMTESLDLNGFLTQLEATSPYGMDENFISTLNSNEELNVPGGFTKTCLDRGFPVDGITRSAIWIKDSEECYSGKFRHSVCIYGIEDLHRLAYLPQLFLNKLMPGYDYGVSICLFETIYNRTHFGEDYSHSIRLNEDYYASVPHVRYNQIRQENNGYVDMDRFNCGFPYPKDYHY